MNDRPEVYVIDGSDNLTKIAETLHEVIERTLTTTVVGIKASGDIETTHHLYIAMTAAAAAINLAAKLMSMPVDPDQALEWAAGPTDRRAILAASLLVARCVVPTDGSVCVEYNITNILAAMEAAEKITGQNNDGIYTPAMVKAARSVVAPSHFFDNSNVAETGNRTLN